MKSGIQGCTEQRNRGTVSKEAAGVTQEENRASDTMVGSVSWERGLQMAVARPAGIPRDQRGGDFSAGGDKKVPDETEGFQLSDRWRKYMASACAIYCR